MVAGVAVGATRLETILGSHLNNSVFFLPAVRVDLYPERRKPRLQSRPFVVGITVGMSYHLVPPFAKRIGETKWYHELARGAPQ